MFDEAFGRDPGSRAYSWYPCDAWTAAVGTIIEAQNRDMDACALVIHQFRPAAPIPDDKRDWLAVLAANQAQVEEFAAAVHAAGSVSFETGFVRPGTRLHVVTVDTTF